MKLKEVVIAVLALALLGGLAVFWLAPAGTRQAPDISLTTLRGEHLSLASLHGRPVLVNFWATTCRSCIEELPQLEELYRDFAPQGLEIIGISMAYDPPNRVVALSRARDIPWPLALDLDNRAATAFGDVRLTPSSFLISPDGRVIHRQVGELDMKQVRNKLAGVLSDDPATAVN